MESNKEGKRAPFTFIWAIVNCTDLSIFNRLQSPVFAVDLMENTKWHLIIWKDNDLIVCCLHREKEDDGPSSIQLEFELSLLASDGSPLIGKKKEKKFAKGGYFIFSWFAKLDDVFLGRKVQFLPKDTLTVRCQMWRTGTEISNADLYFARTLMGMERWFFMWDVKEFSELQLGDFRTYILRPNFKGASPLTLVLSLEEGDEGNDICIAAERGFGIKSYYGISGEISLVDDQERVVHFKSVKTFSNSCNEIVFEFKQFCSRDKLMSKKDTILPNDVLSLRCEFEIDVGPVSSQVESYTHLSPSDIETNMAEMDQACFQNSDKPSTSCCPLKTALKSLYEDETLSDIILQAGEQSFPVHKNILSVRSPVFKAMFSSNMVEKTSDCIDIPDLDADTLHRLLTYIYTDIVQDLQWESALDLYTAADKYELLALREQCSTYLKVNLTAQNACDILTLADLHRDNELQRVVLSFVIEHDDVILNSVKWQNFKTENIKLAMESVERIYFMKRAMY